MQKRLFYEPDASGVGTGHRIFFCARFYYEMEIIINAVSHEIKVFHVEHQSDVDIHIV